MASPFAIFRRNQRVMLAVITVAAMFAFVFFDPIFRMLGRSQPTANPLLVKTSYGNFHASELDSLKQSRRVVEAFLTRVAVAVVRQMVEQKRIPEREENFRIQTYAENLQQQTMGRVSPPGDAAAIETLVLAHRAEELGMVVSDQTINQFLKNITLNSLPASELARIIKSLKTDHGTPMSQTVLFDALRREILASQFALTFQASLGGMPPAQRWEYFEKLNRKADAQLIDVPVVQFVKDVPDPDDATLKKYFESRQNFIQQPNSPEPGFKQPAKTAFQYFKADYEKFVERASAALTPEEVREYYDKNKDFYFRARKLPPVKEGDKHDEPSNDDGANGGAGAADSGQDNAGGSGPAIDAPEGKTPPAADGQPAPTAPEKSTDGTRAAPQPKAPQPNTTQPGGAASPPNNAAPKKTSWNHSGDHNPVRLVSDAQAKPAAQSAPPNAKPAPPATQAAAQATKAAPPATKAGSPAAKPPTVPATQSPASKAPAATESNTPPAAASASGDAPPGDQPPTADTDADTGAADAGSNAKGDANAAGDSKPAVEYEPFEKVQDEIRKTLGQQNARKMIDDTFDALAAKMREYGSERRKYESDKADDPKLEPPAEPDFKALAEEKGVSAYVTDGLTPYEAQTETDLGKSYSIMRDDRSRFGSRTVPFVQIAFSDHQVFRPNYTDDDAGNKYLWWKIRETPEMVPDLADVRSQVLTAFKMNTAREMARKKADEYAKQANEAKKSLKHAFGDREGLEVVDTGPFTWMSTGSLPFDAESSEPRLSDVHGVRAPGDEFMRAVFLSTPGKAAVAMNEPKDNVYVVQVQNFDPPKEQLEHEFLIEDVRKYQGVASQEQRQVYLAWLRELENQAGVEWLETPKVESRNEM